MKKYTAKPQTIRGLGNLHSLREANDYTEEDCTKSSLGNHSFEGIKNNEYELTSTRSAKRLTLTTPNNTVYLGRENYTLTATFKDENGDPITTGTNGATFFINGNQIEDGAGISFNSNGEAIYTGVVTASYPGTWAITAKTTKNNIIYTSNQILLTAIKKPTTITYLNTVRQGTNYTGRLIDTITEQGIKNQTINLRISRSTGESKTYTLTTDKDGYFNIPINLSLGEYWFRISYNGNEIYDPYTTPTVKVTVNNEKRQSVFKNISYEVPRTDYFQAQLVDKETDQPITNQSVSITLSRTNTQSTDNENSSRTYTITTDEDGYCKLQINLNEGLYKFNLEYAGNEAYEPTSTVNNDLTVIPNDKETTYIIGSTSVVQYSNYTGVLVNSTGQPIEGMDILITMTNPTTGQSKTYGTGEIDSEGNVDELITTDSNGQFGKRITLTPGTYQFKSEFQGTTEYLASNTGTLYVTVIEKVKEATHIVADTSVYKGSSITGYLLDESGEGIDGKTVTINIARYNDISQNRDYTVTTEDGLFSLPINLTEDTYIFSYSFDGSEDSTYNSCTLSPVVTEVLAGTIPTTLTLTTAQISVGDYLEFTLLDENENPLDDCEVPITLYREYVDSTTGNLVEQQTTYYADRNGLTENGIVLCYWGITPQADSTYYVSASFAGGAGYMPSSVSKTVLSFTPSNTNLTMTRSPNTSVVALDTRMNFNAQLLDSNNNAMSNKPITLNVTHSRIDGEITLSNNDTVVTATVVDEDNDAVPGLSVGFYNASTDTLIGSSTTDNNGECSYDCTGANSVYCQSSQTDGYEQLTSQNISITNILYQPALDGTENITKISGNNATISNNRLISGCNYLTDGWDNSTDWTLTFKAKLTTTNGCGCFITVSGQYRRDWDWIQINNCDGDLRVLNRVNNTHDYTRVGSPDTNLLDITIVKRTVNGSTTYTTLIDGYNSVVQSNTNLDNASRLVIGVDYWTGTNTSYITDIKVVRTS